MYVQIKEKLQQQILEKRHDGYHLEEDGILIYKTKFILQLIHTLRELLSMKFIKCHILVTQDT